MNGWPIRTIARLDALVLAASLVAILFPVVAQAGAGYDFPCGLALTRSEVARATGSKVTAVNQVAPAAHPDRPVCVFSTNGKYGDITVLYLRYIGHAFIRSVLTPEPGCRPLHLRDAARLCPTGTVKVVFGRTYFSIGVQHEPTAAGPVLKTLARRALDNALADEVAESNLGKVLAAARTCSSNFGSYSTCLLAVLQEIEPSVTLVPGTTVPPPNEVSVVTTPTATAWEASALSASGTCFMIRDDHLIGTTYDQAKSPPGGCSADAVDGTPVEVNWPGVLLGNDAVRANLLAALAAAKTCYADGSSYLSPVPCDPSHLAAIDPRLDFLPHDVILTPSGGPEVGVATPTDSTWGAAALSRSGTCFTVFDDATAGTTYGEGVSAANCDGDHATAGNDTLPGW